MGSHGYDMCQVADLLGIKIHIVIIFTFSSLLMHFHISYASSSLLGFQLRNIYNYLGNCGTLIFNLQLDANTHSTDGGFRHNNNPSYQGFEQF